MYTEEEQRIIEFGEKVEELLKDKRFTEVILKAYMEQTALEVGLAFDGDTKALEAISHLNRWLNQQINDAKIIKSKK